MKHLTVSSQGKINAEQPDEDSPRLHGYWLVLARLLWIALAALILILYFFGFPAAFHYYKTLCIGPGCNGPQLTPAQFRIFSAQGFSLDFFAIYNLSIQFIFVAVWFLVAALIFWHKSNERVAWFVSLMLLTFGATFPDPLGALAEQQHVWWWPVNIVFFLGVVSLILCFFIFPNGRFVPRWTRLIALMWIVWNVYWLFKTGFLAFPGSWLLSYLFLLALGIIVQIFRYRSVSHGFQRQQTKWVVYGFSTAILGFLLLSIGDHAPFFHQNLNPFVTMIINPAYYILMLLIPGSFSIAILRSRLWDIDIIINRTLVYATLTVLLALVYFGLIFALQYLLRGIISQNNDVAIVVSTLAIAALFQPLRHRIQAMIDRRFYRRKYDAAKTLEAFSATLRNELDLNQLREHLITVVQDTMQPSHVSLWLREPANKHPHPDRIPPK
jgi:hypothetical protein